MAEEWRLIYNPEGDMADTVAWPAALITGKMIGAPNTIFIGGFKKLGVSLGYFQDIDTEVDVGKAEDLDVEIVRRLGVGGGTILIDPQGSMAMLMTFNKDRYANMDKAFCQIGGALAQAYWRVGATRAWYDHIGDIKVGMNKITGFGFAEIGSIMVQNTIYSLGPPDVEKFLQVAKIPPEKWKDKSTDDVKKYIASVEAETGKRPSKEEFRDAVVEAFEDMLDIKLVEGEMAPEEKKAYEGNRTIALSEEHNFRVSSSKRFAEIPADHKLGMARNKARKLIVAHVLTDKNDVVKDAMISGDFYCSPLPYLGEMEQSLAGVKATDENALVNKVKETFAKPDWQIPMVDPEDIATAINMAAQQ
ncbi:MAG: biotin/lipoate A/B protein ligase family protein [Candidatus Lokiarchaeia archaeon]